MKKLFSLWMILLLCITGCGSVEQTASEAVNTFVNETEVSANGTENSVNETKTSENETEASVNGAAADENAAAVSESEDVNVSILMVGDILLHDRVEAAALQEDGTYAYEAIFAHTSDTITAADLAIVNQEVILGGAELGVSGYPAFNAPFTVGEALTEAGFDVICHATNHALDKGRKGVLNCTAYWREQHPEIAVLGLFDSQEAQDSLYIYEQDGVKLAILNYTYGTNGIPLPKDMPYAVNLLEKQRVFDDIRRAEDFADFTIVCPHWGTEYQLEQSAAQEEWAALFAANGVDLVIGTHPHVVQPVEWVIDEATGHEMLVYYSLGNFVNWTGESGTGIANRMIGAMAQITLTKEANQVVIAEYGVEPIVSHLQSGVNGVTVYKLSDYTEALANENEIRLQDAAFSKKYCEQLCERVFGTLYTEGKASVKQQ